MKKSILIVGAIVILGFIIAGFYFYDSEEKNIENKYSYSEITYDDCVADELNNLRKLPSAEYEPIGAKRTDNEGNDWIKQEDGSWKTDAKGFENTAWGDSLIDEQIGGVNYFLEEFPKCEKYIFTRNAKMEQGISQVMDELILEQKGTISVSEIEVLNLAGRLQASMELDCEEEISFEAEEKIIESLANKLFKKYPNEFAEGSEKDSRVEVRGCSKTGSSPDGINTYYSQTDWGIFDGQVDIRI